MNFKLIPFSSSPFEITGTLERKGDELILHYDLQGPLSELVIPEINSSGLFKDGLWKHSCFELFIKDQDQRSYTEFNFSPSGDYAIYRFSDYRKKDLDYRYRTFPQISASITGDHLFMDIIIETLSGEVAICAVIENHRNEINYYALTHQKEKPDFHDPASFILSI